MNVFITEKVYFISINGKHHSAYVFRIPLARVTVLKIVGKVEIQKVAYGKLSSYPPENALFKVPTVKDSVAPLPLVSNKTRKLIIKGLLSCSYMIAETTTYSSVTGRIPERVAVGNIWQGKNFTKHIFC